MTLPKVVLATKNAGKVAEMGPLVTRLGIGEEVATGLEWPDVEETGSTLAANASLKARAVMKATGIPALADDTGLEVSALGGRPGVHTARYAGPNATFDDNIDRLLDELRDAPDRSARFVTVVALVRPDGVEETAEGSIHGRIAEARRGTGGFGYDPVFEVDGVTLSEMGMEAKNRLSHRARALEALAAAIRR